MAVRVEDTQEDPMAKKLGISQEPYPNVAVYDPSGEFVGRVVGFGGKAPWFGDLKEAVATGETLAAAKKAAEGDGAKWVDVAEVLKGIPGRAKDALAALEKAPAKTKKSKLYKAAEASVQAHLAWAEAATALDEMLKGVRTVEEVREKAPAALEKIDAFLKAHAGADKVVEPQALSRRGFYLVLLDKEKEAMEIARKLLTDFPESDQAKALLRGLR